MYGEVPLLLGFRFSPVDTATGGSLLTSGEAESDASTRTADSAKIIYTANLTLETRDYDTARAALDAALSDADGYMESRSRRSWFATSFDERSRSSRSTSVMVTLALDVPDMTELELPVL